MITALYTDMEDVVDLIDDLGEEWLRNNAENGHPVSIVLSGLFDDVHRCCQRTGSREHTYLHSLGFFGRTENVARPCVCGIVNRERAGEVFRRLVEVS